MTISSKFSNFIRNATAQEKEAVYLDVIDKAIAMQRETVIKNSCKNQRKLMINLKSKTASIFDYKPRVHSGDWTEDFHLENGNYYNICISCDEVFIGYKRRRVCKNCYVQSKLTYWQRFKRWLGL